MNFLRGLNLPIPQTLTNTQLVDLAAVVLFAMTLLFLVLRLRQRIRLGQKYLDDLPDKSADIAEAISDAARLATLDEPSEEASNAFVVSGSPRQVKDVLEPENRADAAMLRQPLAELNNGLLNLTDNLIASMPSDDGTQRFVAFQRVSESFSAQLPDRFVAASRAIAFSRLSVQAGLAFSVLFILRALMDINNDDEVLRNVTFKFGFTLVGLTASVAVQLMLGSATRMASLAFLKFEEELNRKLSIRIMSPLAGSYQLLQDQRVLKEELKHTLDAFSEQIGKLEQGAASLSTAAGHAASTLTDVMAATRKASAEVSLQVAEHVKAMADAMEEAQSNYRTKIDGHASRVITRYGSALKAASIRFKATAGEAGADFGKNVSTAAKTLSTSCAETTNSFEKQFETASKHYLESVGKIGETTAEVANIQASLVQRVADEEERASARIGELTSEAVDYLNQVMNEKKAEILEEIRKKRFDGDQLGLADILQISADSESADVAEESEPADIPVETPTNGPRDTEPDTPRDPPTDPDDERGLEL
ncbi:MAG: hypothetical protein R3F50_18350 [Gammaproteobacteria bacterium]